MTDKNNIPLIVALLALIIAIGSCNQRRQVAMLEKENLRLSIELKKMELAQESETDTLNWFQRIDSLAFSR